MSEERGEYKAGFDIEDALDELAREAGSIVGAYEWGMSTSEKYLDGMKACITAEFTALRQRAEAAEAEIKKLREALENYSEDFYGNDCFISGEIARKALGDE